MAKIPDLHRFTAGMDLDSDPRYVAPESTRLQRNTRYDDVMRSTAGSTTNHMGNQLTTLGPYKLYGVNTEIGSCYDEKRNSIIWFIHSDYGAHAIYSYDIYTEQVNRLLFNPAPYWRNNCKLNFSLVNKIHDAHVIGDVLYFRDDKKPRKLNLLKAKNIGNVNSYPYIDDSVIDAINYPPTSECATVLTTDYLVKSNNLKRRYYQFRYRWIYDDYGESVCSPICKSVLAKDGYTYDGSDIFDYVIYNAIDISVKTGSCSVSFIEVMHREGISGDWVLSKVIDKHELSILDDSVYTYRFYGNSVVSAVDQKNINRPFDYLPIQTNSQELIDGKYLAYGGCVEGFDNVPVSCVMGSIKDILPIGVVGLQFFQLQSSNYDVVDGDVTYSVSVLFNDPGIISVLTNDYMMVVEISLFIKYPGETAYTNPVSRSRSYQVNTATNANSVQSFHDYLKGYINSDFSDFSVACDELPPNLISPNPPFPLVPDGAELAITPLIGESVSQGVAKIESRVYFHAIEEGASISEVYGGAKSGCLHRFGLVYSDDAGRLSTVQTNETCEIYIKSTYEVAAGEVSTQSNNFRNIITWGIFHDPPAWATKYHWAYAGRSGVGAFRQYIIGGALGEKAVYNIPNDSSSSYINLSLLNELTFKGTFDSDTGEMTDGSLSVEFPISTSLLHPYIFSPGDRVRFITAPYVNRPGNGGGGFYPLGKRINDYIDVEIIGYAQDTDGDDTNTIRVSRIFVDSNTMNRGSLVEIYSVNKNYSNEVYYEIGETYNIDLTSGVGVHSVQSGSFGAVDVAHILRPMPYRLSPDDSPGHRRFWVESDMYSDFFDSPVFTNGRVNLYDITAKSKFSNVIRRSNPYFAETKTNGLGSFEYDKYLPIDASHGDIRSLSQIGYTLKIVQDRKVTSVYIGKNGLRQAGADGAQVVVATDNVFNTTNPSELPYGSSDPESIVVRERQMFFFDRNSKCIVRDSANGPEDISSLWKISSLVRSIADDIATNGGSVVAGVNNKYGEVVFTFTPTTGDPVTILLSQKYGNAKCLLDYADETGLSPSGYINAGDYFYSFLSGRIWKHDVNPTRGSFFGVNNNMEISFVSNVSPQTVKLYDSIVQNSNKKFTSEEYEDIQIVASENQPLGMVSKLTAYQYKSEEGVWYAPLLRNAVTSSPKPNIMDLINGDPLRGQFMQMTIRNSDTTEVILHSIIINCTHSPLTR